MLNGNHAHSTPTTNITRIYDGQAAETRIDPIHLGRANVWEEEIYDQQQWWWWCLKNYSFKDQQESALPLSRKVWISESDCVTPSFDDEEKGAFPDWREKTNRQRVQRHTTEYNQQIEIDRRYPRCCKSLWYCSISLRDNSVLIRQSDHSNGPIVLHSVWDCKFLRYQLVRPVERMK